MSSLHLDLSKTEDLAKQIHVRLFGEASSDEDKPIAGPSTPGTRQAAARARARRKRDAERLVDSFLDSDASMSGYDSNRSILSSKSRTSHSKSVTFSNAVNGHHSGSGIEAVESSDTSFSGSYVPRFVSATLSELDDSLEAVVDRLGLRDDDVQLVAEVLQRGEISRGLELETGRWDSCARGLRRLLGATQCLARAFIGSMQELERLHGSNDSNLAEIDALKTLRDSLAEENDKRAVELTTVKAILQSKTDEYDATVGELRSQVAALEKDLSAAKQNTMLVESTREEKIGTLQTQNRELQEDLRAAQERTTVVEGELAEFEAKSLAKQQELEDRIVLLSESLDDAKKSLEEESRERKEAERELANSHKSFEELKKQCELLEKDLQTATTNARESVMRVHDEQLARQKAEDSLRDSERSFALVREELERVRLAGEEARAKLAEAEIAVISAKEEKTTLQRRADVLAKRDESLRSRVEELESALMAEEEGTIAIEEERQTIYRFLSTILSSLGSIIRDSHEEDHDEHLAEAHDLIVRYRRGVQRRQRDRRSSEGESDAHSGSPFDASTPKLPQVLRSICTVASKCRDISASLVEAAEVAQNHQSQLEHSQARVKAFEQELASSKQKLKVAEKRQSVFERVMHRPSRSLELCEKLIQERCFRAWSGVATENRGLAVRLTIAMERAQWKVLAKYLTRWYRVAIGSRRREDFITWKSRTKGLHCVLKAFYAWLWRTRLAEDHRRMAIGTMNRKKDRFRMQMTVMHIMGLVGSNQRRREAIAQFIRKKLLRLRQTAFHAWRCQWYVCQSAYHLYKRGTLRLKRDAFRTWKWRFVGSETKEENLRPVLKRLQHRGNASLCDGEVDTALSLVDIVECLCTSKEKPTTVEVFTECVFTEQERADPLSPSSEFSLADTPRTPRHLREPEFFQAVLRRMESTVNMSAEALDDAQRKIRQLREERDFLLVQVAAQEDAEEEEGTETGSVASNIEPPTEEASPWTPHEDYVEENWEEEIDRTSTAVLRQTVDVETETETVIVAVLSAEVQTDEHAEVEELQVALQEAMELSTELSSRLEESERALTTTQVCVAEKDGDLLEMQSRITTLQESLHNRESDLLRMEQDVDELCQTVVVLKDALQKSRATSEWGDESVLDESAETEGSVVESVRGGDTVERMPSSVSAPDLSASYRISPVIPRSMSEEVGVQAHESEGPVAQEESLELMLSHSEGSRGGRSLSESVASGSERRVFGRPNWLPEARSLLWTDHVTLLEIEEKQRPSFISVGTGSDATILIDGATDTLDAPFHWQEETRVVAAEQEPLVEREEREERVVGVEPEQGAATVSPGVGYSFDDWEDGDGAEEEGWGADAWALGEGEELPVATEQTEGKQEPAGTSLAAIDAREVDLHEREAMLTDSFYAVSVSFFGETKMESGTQMDAFDIEPNRTATMTQTDDNVFVHGNAEGVCSDTSAFARSGETVQRRLADLSDELVFSVSIPSAGLNEQTGTSEVFAPDEETAWETDAWGEDEVLELDLGDETSVQAPQLPVRAPLTETVDTSWSGSATILKTKEVETQGCQTDIFVESTVPPQRETTSAAVQTSDRTAETSSKALNEWEEGWEDQEAWADEAANDRWDTTAFDSSTEVMKGEEPRSQTTASQTERASLIEESFTTEVCTHRSLTTASVEAHVVTAEATTQIDEVKKASVNVVEVVAQKGSPAKEPQAFEWKDVWDETATEADDDGWATAELHLPVSEPTKSPVRLAVECQTTPTALKDAGSSTERLLTTVEASAEVVWETDEAAVQTEAQDRTGSPSAVSKEEQPAEALSAEAAPSEGGIVGETVIEWTDVWGEDAEGDNEWPALDSNTTWEEAANRSNGEEHGVAGSSALHGEDTGETASPEVDNRVVVNMSRGSMSREALLKIKEDLDSLGDTASRALAFVNDSFSTTQSPDVANRAVAEDDGRFDARNPADEESELKCRLHDVATQADHLCFFWQRYFDMHPTTREEANGYFEKLQMVRSRLVDFNNESPSAAGSEAE